MNPFYTYENLPYWDEKIWKDKISSVYPLVTFMGETEKPDPTPWPQAAEDPRALPCYDKKTNCVSLPEVVSYWNERGVHYERRAQGGRGWLIMAPKKAMADFAAKIPALVVIVSADNTDPYWAMKVLERFKAYNEEVARRQDFCIFYICGPRPDYERIYVNILQEAFVFAPSDVNRTYLDVSPVYTAGKKLADVPGFTYRDDNGAEADPDAAVFSFTDAAIPALDITARWENRVSLSRDQISMDNWSSMGFDLQRVIRSESGRRLAEGMELEYRYDTSFDEGFLARLDAMGLIYENRETQNRRWKMACPKNAFSLPDGTLPLLLVMQEVNHANEHLAVTEVSYFLEYYRIAAQGECALLSFVLEDANDNELLTEIVEEARAAYPFLDMTRVYIAGHSHNGHYSLEFATRHPDLIAAVATFGDAPGLQNSGITPMTPERAEEAAKHDLPLIALAGMKEFSVLYPINQDGKGYRPGKDTGIVSFEDRVKSYQLRLKVSRCPMKTAEEIAATRESPERAIRMLGIPGDHSEVVWMDGFECYIVDVKNVEGKVHLRFVGEENMPHNTTPNQQNLSWSFLRRFRRDPETHEIIEL